MIGTFWNFIKSDPFRDLTNLGRKLYYGTSSIHDLESWERSLQELRGKRLSPSSQYRLAIFENELFIDYLLLHAPNDSRVTQKYGEKTEIASRSVHVKLASIALWETYILTSHLPDIDGKCLLWRKDVREYVNVDASDKHGVIFHQQIGPFDLLKLMRESERILRSSRKNISDQIWNNQCDQLLPRIRNLAAFLPS